MHDNSEILKTIKTSVSVIELKRLLVELRDKSPETFFRCRLLGEMWMTNFMRVIQVAENNLLLNDDVKNIFIAIGNLESIMQFELDQRFQNYQPYFHYDVINTSEI